MRRPNRDGIFYGDTGETVVSSDPSQLSIRRTDPGSDAEICEEASQIDDSRDRVVNGRGYIWGITLLAYNRAVKSRRTR